MSIANECTPANLFKYSYFMATATQTPISYWMNAVSYDMPPNKLPRRLKHTLLSLFFLCLHAATLSIKFFWNSSCQHAFFMSTRPLYIFCFAFWLLHIWFFLCFVILSTRLSNTLSKKKNRVLFCMCVYVHRK